MKKTVITAAIAGAFVLPGASWAEVTISGWLNMNIEAIKIKNSDIPTRQRVSSNTSELVFSGKEDLGGGNSVFFRVAQDLRLDGSTPNAGWATRDSFFGMQGNWGRLFMGRRLTPYELSHIVYDVWFGTGIADSEAVMGNCANNFVGCFSLRTSNSVIYESPKFGGFDFKLHYVPDEAKTSTTDSYIFSTSVHYGQRPFDVHAAYERHNDGVGGAGTDDVGLKLAGTFSFGKTKVGAGVERLKYETSPTTDAKLNTYLLNLVHSVGNFDIRLQWTHATNTKGSSCPGGVVPAIGSFVGGSPGCAIGDSGVDQYTVGATYNFSKRTAGYLYYTRMDNDRNAAWDFVVNPAGITAPGQKPTGIALGMIHSF